MTASISAGSRERVAVYPGSFDPITNGHVDIIQRGLRLFDRVVVGVLVNDAKAPLFSAEERVAIVEDVFAAERRVTVAAFKGLLVEFARSRGACALVRGLRAVSDFEYEFQMALMNRRLAPEIETAFLMADEHQVYTSSRLIKEVAALGGNVEGLVPPIVGARLAAKLGTREP